jgi:uroporphyrinogen-III synthase
MVEYECKTNDPCNSIILYRAPLHEFTLMGRPSDSPAQQYSKGCAGNSPKAEHSNQIPDNNTTKLIIQKTTLQNKQRELKNKIDFQHCCFLKEVLTISFLIVYTMNSTIGIMRPMRYVEESLALTKSLNLDAIICSMLETQDTWDEDFDDFVDRVLTGSADYVIFTSANGVDFTLQKITEREKFIKCLNKCKIAAIGPNTRHALEQQGIHTSLLPEVYSSLGLVEMMRDVAGEHVDIVRSTHGAPVLVEKLLEYGAVVHETCVYTIVHPHGDCQREFMKCVQSGTVDILPFTSTMMVHNFMNTAKDMQILEDVLSQMNTKMSVGAIGLPTANTLKKYGVNKVVMPKKYLFKDLLLALRKEKQETAR